MKVEVDVELEPQAPEPMPLQALLETDEGQDAEPDFLGRFHTQAIPPQIIARITPAPALPVMEVKWKWQAAGYTVVSVNHRAFIQYAEHGRNDQSRELRFTNGSLVSVLNFAPDLLGGALQAFCSVNWRRNSDGATGTTPEGTQQFGILADNPAKNDIRTVLADLPLQVIAYKESRFRQFDNASLPLWGPPNGFGVMQLDTPRPTARQIWDWRQNAAGGRALLDTKRREVAQHYENEYRKYPDAPRLTADQMKQALYQYYNGGWYWTWDVAAKKWNGSGPYGDDAMRVERLVASGQPPADWN